MPFEKMHGLGNDFIVIERRNMPNGTDDQKLAKILCDRNFGIGADGIIIVDFSSQKDCDFVWNYYNSDGSEAEMCGNGMRCFAKYVFERGFIESNKFSVLTKAGIISPVIEEDGEVTVVIGKPSLPRVIKEQIQIDSKIYNYTYIEVGNPHCVIFLDEEISDEDFFKYGPLLERNQRFPNGVNVEFSKVLSNDVIKCRVWERGCGPTLACGTGACATLVAAVVNGLTNDIVVVKLPGGDLNVKWDRLNDSVMLKGPAVFVFTGQYNLNPSVICKSLV